MRKYFGLVLLSAVVTLMSVGAPRSLFGEIGEQCDKNNPPQPPDYLEMCCYNTPPCEEGECTLVEKDCEWVWNPPEEISCTANCTWSCPAGCDEGGPPN